MIELDPSDLRLIALESDSQVTALLIEFGLPAPRYVTDCAFDITSGGNVYRSVANNIVNISLPQESSEIQRHTLEITLADPDPAAADSWNSLFSNPTGVPVALEVVFIVNEAISAPLNIYRGRCVGVQSIPNDDGGAALVASFASQLSKLDNSHSVLATDAAQRAIDPTDTSLRFIHDTRQLQWGA